jgi:hypothetical protein
MSIWAIVANILLLYGTGHTTPVKYTDIINQPFSKGWKIPRALPNRLQTGIFCYTVVKTIKQTISFLYKASIMNFSLTNILIRKLYHRICN